MPSQIKIISAVNHCLKQKLNIDFELNKNGVCAGLAGLYVKYALENKLPKFFNILDRLSKLPKDYQLGTDADINEFIIQIEKVFNPSNYSSYQINQGDLEKILTINNKPLKNEYNLGLITGPASWAELLNKVSRDRRGYYITSHNHAIGIFFKHGKYHIYDPNYSQRTKEFTSAKEVIQELQKCFDYPDDLLGLSLRIFTDPEATPEVYPDHNELHTIAFAKEEDKKCTMDIETRKHQSSSFATAAKDPNTLAYLFKENSLHWDTLAVEFLLPEFNELLLKQPDSAQIRAALVKSITINIYTGNVKMVERLIAHYNLRYNSFDEQNNLKENLVKTFETLGQNHLGIMKNEQNYHYILDLYNQFLIPLTGSSLTHYNHLKLLNLLHEEATQDKFSLFLTTLTPEQLIKQIELAALLNQKNVLNVLINQLKTAGINPKVYPTPLTKSVLEKINSANLGIIIDNGFSVNTNAPELLTVCARRIDKTIFERYARAFSTQTNLSHIWAQIDKNAYGTLNLTTLIGPFTLLNVLLLLKKNTSIKQCWRDDIPVQIIKEALTEAILSGNIELSRFLQEKLRDKNANLDPDTLDFLYQTALTDENLVILTQLTDLNFNVLNNTKDIRKIFSICSAYNDYSIIENSFSRANPAIRKLILETALSRNTQEVITTCINTEPQLFNNLLHDYIRQKDTPKFNTLLGKINSRVSALPANTLNLPADAAVQKEFISYCFHSKFFHLTRTLSESIKWTKTELNQLLNELILTKNEEGIIQLLKQYPQLKENADLFNQLLHYKYLNSLNFLLTPDWQLTPEQIQTIFVTAFEGNNKDIIERLLAQKRITPVTPLKVSLVELLHQAIRDGHDKVLEPFISSTEDFGIDFKELFIFSCEHKQAAIANKLYSKAIELNEKEVTTAIKQLFGEQSPEAIFESIYQNTYGHLYSLLIKSNTRNPKSELLSSLRDAATDRKFRQTGLFAALPPLRRALAERNADTFLKLFAETNLPDKPDTNILMYLKDPGFTPKILSVFEKKYTLEALINTAITEQEWAVVANLIAHHPMDKFSQEIQSQLHQNSKNIIYAFVDTINDYYDKEDLRPKLFDLLYLHPKHPKILNQLAIPHYEFIQKHLITLELRMISKNMNLNNQIYRHTFSNREFVEGMDQIREAFKQCNATLNLQQINLEEPIINEDIISQFAHIKALMAKYDITPAYFTEAEDDLFSELAENPRFKKTCEQELIVYSLMKQFNLAEKSLVELPEAYQKEFKKALKTLDKELSKSNLSVTFTIPEIQTHLTLLKKTVTKTNPATNDTLPVNPSELPQPVVYEEPIIPVVSPQTNSRAQLSILKDKCSSGIIHYLQNRDKHMSYLSYYFDYERGKTRARHFINLINGASSQSELNVLLYALLSNTDGPQLKKEVAAALGYDDEHEARIELKETIKNSSLKNYLPYLDDIIDLINPKINSNDPTVTKDLFSYEIKGLKHLCQSRTALGQHSFFQPEHIQQKMSLWQWIGSWFGYSGTTDDHKLSK